MASNTTTTAPTTIVPTTTIAPTTLITTTASQITENCKNRTQCESAGGRIQISYGEVCIPSEKKFCTNNTNSHGIVSSLYVQHPLVNEEKNRGTVNSSATLLVDGAWKNEVHHYALFVKFIIFQNAGYLDVDGGIQLNHVGISAEEQSTAVN